MNKEHPADIVLSFKDKDAYNQLNTGDKIKVWSSQTLESYPAKMIVEKFEIVENKRQHSRCLFIILQIVILSGISLKFLIRLL